jgi:hypothetical protein
MRTAIGLRVSASSHLLCHQATSKHSNMVALVHGDLPPWPDEAVTFLLHYGVSDEHS